MGERAPLALVIVLVGLPFTAAACPYAVRDAGYIARDPLPYRLCLVVRGDTASKDDLARWLSQASERHLPDANIAAELVAAEAGPDHPAVAHCRAAGVRALPAAVLLSPTDEALLLHAGANGPLTSGAVDALVAAAVTSPKREELRQHLVRPWCVVVLAEGTRRGPGNLRARQAIQTAIRKAQGLATEMAPVIKHPPKLIVAGPADANDERVFLWGLGLLEGDLARPRAAVVFGAGRRLGPALEGAGIAEATLLELFQFLGMNCTCTSDPSQVLGPQVPLAWDIGIQTEVARALGFDPNSPRAVMALAGVWTSVARPNLPRQGIFGYTEEVIEFGPAPPPSDVEGEGGLARPADGPSLARPGRASRRAAASSPATTAAAAPEASLGARTKWLVVAIMAALAGVAVAGGLAVALWRAGRKA